MSTCPHCQIQFNKFEDFREHLEAQHRHLPLDARHKALESKPGRDRNTSGRSKAQIVYEAEQSWLAASLVGHVALEHSLECHCPTCWNKLADAILAQQEKELNND